VAPSPRLSTTPAESSKRERKAIVLLTVAFVVLSALMHFILGSFYHPLPAPPEAVPQPHETLIMGTLDTPPPTPTPPPVTRTETPKPAAASSAAPFRHGPISPPSTSPRGTAGPGIDVLPSGPPGNTESPVPDASPSAVPAFGACRIVRKVEPDYPDSEKQAGISGTVIVVISIAPDGQVLSARVGASSGNAALDRAAVDAAQRSSYACPHEAGRPEAELYQVVYQFRLDS
jgi:periplasmic protein TonB